MPTRCRCGLLAKWWWITCRLAQRTCQRAATQFGSVCTLDAILDQADVISFHIPQNQETLFFANDAFFSKIEKPIFLLNLSRGKIVKTEALVKAIENGKVLGAGFFDL